MHLDASSISAPVTNGMTIKLVLTLMLASGGIAHVVNVKEHFFMANLTMERRSTSRFYRELRNSMMTTQFYC
jgi:hypothetical protein